MLRPSVDELLAGVADALADTVVPALPDGPERDQVRGAVGILRRVARTLPTLAPRLEEDTIALARAVRELGGGREGAGPEVGAALDFAEALVMGPALDELARANLALRAELARLAAAVEAGSPLEAALVGHLQALAEREAALRLSPWER